ncbi:MAG: DNA repair protein RecN [Gammaproteobacteria bacterium]
MLTHIHIRNFAIVDEIDLELDGGMTALTGETGAGKSILVDALGLVLGDRADNSVIRHGCDRAEISAGFDIHDRSGVSAWLASRDLDMDGECQLRRIISRTGRTRCYINGQPVPTQSLRILGEQLVDIHGQHEHQSLLRTGVQRQLLDSFGGHDSLLGKLTTLHADWKAADAALQEVMRNDSDRDARLDLLRYQAQELEALGLTAPEILELDAEFVRQANAGRLLESCVQGLARLDGDTSDNAYSLISTTLNECTELTGLDTQLEATGRLLNETLVLLQESIDALRHYSEQLEIDPKRLHWLEERIGILHDLSRKHRCRPQELPAILEHIHAELDSIEHADQNRETLQEQLRELSQAYLETATKLGAQRVKAARLFGKQITGAMQTLGMEGGQFEVSVSSRPDKPYASHGLDTIEFRVSANKGQPVRPLGKVASGGELSRISLAIQVISADSETIPTLIFDEVDSGIGGGVAEIVGQKLRALGSGRQVLCVTHLHQVAAQASQQLQVTKLSGADTTRTRIRKLDGDERIDELARMLGGINITAQTREHAREMINQAQGTVTPKRKKKKTKRAG